MIKKIVSGDLTLRPDFTNIQELAITINEIIDHLPQEKESHLFCAVCKERIKPNLEHKCGIMNEPTKEVKDTGGFMSRTRDEVCPKCGLYTCLCQPTKEVPDIRYKLRKIIKKLVIGNQVQGSIGDFETQVEKQTIDQAIQEISALYRKEV